MVATEAAGRQEPQWSVAFSLPSIFLKLKHSYDFCVGSSEGWGECIVQVGTLGAPVTSAVQCIVCAVIYGGPRENLHHNLLLGTVDLNSWREKIARDVAGATWGNGSGEEEEEEDGPAVLVEQQTDSAMEPTGPTRERYKDGVVTIGCVGKEAMAHAWQPPMRYRVSLFGKGGCRQ